MDEQTNLNGTQFDAEAKMEIAFMDSPKMWLGVKIIGKMVGKTPWDGGTLSNQPQYIYI